MSVARGLYRVRWQFVSLILTVASVATLYVLMPLEVTLGGTVLAALAVAYVLIQQRLTGGRLQTVVMFVWLAAAVVLLGWGGWQVLRGDLDLLSYLFVVPIALVYFHVLSIVPFAFYQRYVGRDQFEPSDLPTVTAVVPAYNEQRYIGRAIESLLATEYPDDKLEIIVVDDGSTDATYERASEYVSDHVRLFHKENGGKHSALNYALTFADGEIIVTIDADCIVGETALTELVAPFQTDASIGAVAGDLRRINRHSHLMQLQALEYSVGINLHRRMFDLFGGVPVVPGCLGAFRRSALDTVRHYDPDTLTEDYDLTIKLLKAGYDVRTSSALVYTEVPDTWYSLYRQRLRWYRGNLMTHLKHVDVFRRPTYGVLHSVTFPLRMIAMLLGPLVTVLVIVSVVVAAASGTLVTVAIIFGAFMLINLCSTLLALQLKGQDLSLIAYALPLSTVYKLFRDAVTLKAIVDVLLRSDLGWTSATRIRHRSDVEQAEYATDGGDR